MNELGQETIPSLINNPFLKEKIIKVYILFSPKLFSNGEEWTAHGTVEFQNGNTKGLQTFKSPSFDGVVIQMREFINSLQI